MQNNNTQQAQNPVGQPMLFGWLTNDKLPVTC